MKARIVATAIALAVLTGCATAPQHPAPTVDIHVADVTTVRDAVAAKLGAKGNITEMGANSLTIERPLEGGQSVAYQLLLGNSFSTAPKATVKLFFIKPAPDTVRMMGNVFVSTQMAFGQVNQTEVTGDYGTMQLWFNKLKTELEAAK